MDIEVTEEFIDTLKLIEDGHPFIFVTGKAGTGKSTFINFLKKRLDNFAVVSPTGVSALNVGGQTIHSFFRIKPGPIDLSEIKRIRGNGIYKALEILIIDEISMVRADLMDAISVSLDINRRNSGVPFGGVQVVAVGDLFQLPPVVSTQEERAFISNRYDSEFFFSSEVLKKLPLKVMEFTKVFRQKEKSFVSLLNKIREGREIEKSLDILNKKVEKNTKDTVNSVMLTSTNNIAGSVNTKKIRALKGVTRTFKGEIKGSFVLNGNNLPAPMTLDLKPEAKVMFVKNDTSKNWVNGTLGRVKSFGDNCINVYIDDELGAREVAVERVSWDSFKYKYDPVSHSIISEKVGSYRQFPLMLSWAITIHKSQGKTFNDVHINLGRGAFSEGQVYVALSRCKTLEGITLENRIRERDIILSYDVVDFYKKNSLRK